MSATDSSFTVGRQPCQAFRAHIEGNGYGTWSNRHECFGPRIRGEPGNCAGTVSLCENCKTDHHEGGYETCPIKEEPTL